MPVVVVRAAAIVQRAVEITVDTVVDMSRVVAGLRDGAVQRGGRGLIVAGLPSQTPPLMRRLSNSSV